MTDYAVFSFQLDLLLRLIDTTTGTLVTEKIVSLFRNGKRVSAMTKETGQYLFLNTGREDFELTVRVAGFEEKRQVVTYETLDQKLPSIDLHLIPSAQSPAGARCHTLEGTIEGISSIDAARSSNSACHAKEFDERKRILKVFNPHHLEMDHIYYALLNLETGEYERFEIVKRISDQEYKISKRLEKEFESHFPISRIVFGEVYPGGRYLLRLPDDSRDARWLVRMTVNDEDRFYTINCNKPETMQLTKEVI